MKTTVVSIASQTTQNSESAQQHMTSLEIAELTGKQHKNLMRDIRNMEPAWEKVQGLKFELSSRIYQLPNGGTKEVPCYVLNKTECLYIATKFNDEARAKLVLRWEELEHERMAKMISHEIKLIAANDEEVLNEADVIIGEELDDLNKYSDNCYTPTEVGKPFGMDGRDLNSFLADKGVIRWGHGQWQLTPDYLHRGLAENRSFIYHGRNGQRKTQSRLVWTEKGREFINDLIEL
ncbi:Phage antirepressor protein KilAC domain-containing protein [Prevotella sp. ne3005]|uniref:phage regulatory protein/antirepressor Ant n=1 Tax=Prevotella sp. ne3005 TaxID=1761887 RepID=UPI0008D1262A|nr:phage regulatory protein/antirepressor Ant [Prevotella sp. ne3005]SEM96009.1 Phage antirepressor protein KilAC domain-containing protein [Prevotella sp. ne3005]